VNFFYQFNFVIQETQTALVEEYRQEKIENIKEFNLPTQYRRSQSALWRKLNPLLVSI
jgi:hypothetical protein